MADGWKQACREQCAFFGDPPCYTLPEPAGKPCDACDNVGALIDKKDAENKRLRGVLMDAHDQLVSGDALQARLTLRAELGLGPKTSDSKAEKT
jgi:hypothetical protein